MTYVNPDALVSTDWLGEHLNDPTVRVIDCSWHQPVLKRDAVAEFADVHIPGAAYFNIDDIADESSSLPHMIPDTAKFSERVGKLGISNDHQKRFHTHGNEGLRANRMALHKLKRVGQLAQL